MTAVLQGHCRLVGCPHRGCRWRRRRLPVRLGGRGSFAATTAPARGARLRPAAGLGHGGLAAVGPGDGVFGIDCHAGQPRFANYAHTHFVVRHVISVGVAFVAALIAFQVPVRTWEKMAPWLFVLSLVLLMRCWCRLSARA